MAPATSLPETAEQLPVPAVRLSWSTSRVRFHVCPAEQLGPRLENNSTPGGLRPTISIHPSRVSNTYRRYRLGVLEPEWASFSGAGIESRTPRYRGTSYRTNIHASMHVLGQHVQYLPLVGSRHHQRQTIAAFPPRMQLIILYIPRIVFKNCIRGVQATLVHSSPCVLCELSRVTRVPTYLPFLIKCTHLDLTSTKNNQLVVSHSCVALPADHHKVSTLDG